MKTNHSKIICKILLFSIVLPFLIFSSQISSAENLLINPGAETGDITGWTPEPPNFWVAASNHMTPHDGSYLFWPGGGSLAYGSLSQNVDVSSYADSIDNGGNYFHLSGWMINWNQYPHDRSTLAIAAINETGDQLAFFSRDHRSPTYGFYQIESQIPPGTRTLRVQLIATRYVGTNNDGHFDSISLQVDEVAPSIFVSLYSNGDVNTIADETSLQFTASTTGGNDTDYTWSSSFEAVATVDSNGLVSAHRPGRVIIQAQGNQTQVVGSMELTVYATNYVIFTQPVNGETLASNSTALVRWDLQGTLTSGSLFYSTSGGSSWTKIASISNLDVIEYAWNVVETTTPLNDCVLKMTWNGGESFSSSFRINPDGSPCDDGNACTKDDRYLNGSCVAGGYEEAGVACGNSSDTECDNPDTCDGAGTCLSNHESSATACGDSATECSNVDFCDGAGSCVDNGFVAPGTACGNQSNTACDNPDTCDGAGTCLSNYVSAATACGDPSVTECDNPDTCDGAGICLTNYVSAATACGDPSDTECDNPDTCDGAGICLPNYEPSTTVCRTGSGDACDPNEYCPGSVGQPCPEDIVTAAGTLCNKGNEGACDPDAYCTGVAGEICPQNTDVFNDADNDGVIDCWDLCPQTLTSTPVNNRGCPYLSLCDVGGDGKIGLEEAINALQIVSGRRTNCSSNSDCSESTYCSKLSDNCTGQGACLFKPESCMTLYDPVCGCDGITYGNACEAALQGINIASLGECISQ